VELKLQEYTFEVQYKKGEENTVADCLSRCVTAKCLANSLVVTEVRAYSISSAWPELASNQKALDEVPCTVCGDLQGHDNMVMCEGCNGCFTCVVLFPYSPQCLHRMCPACDPFFMNGGGPDLLELRDDATPLTSSKYDPYLDSYLLDYVLNIVVNWEHW
jgi:hypothetical protein